MNHFAQLDREGALAQKAGVWPQAFAGRTDPLIRARRIEAAIFEKGCADEVARVSSGGALITFRLEFALTYNRALQAEAA